MLYSCIYLYLFRFLIGTYHGKLEGDTRTTKPFNVGGGRGIAYFDLRVDGTRPFSAPHLDAFDDDLGKLVLTASQVFFLLSFFVFFCFIGFQLILFIIHFFI